MSVDKWGSYEWNEAHFPEDKLESSGDTWGMRWKAMDKLRHQSYLAMVQSDLMRAAPIKFLDLGCALCDFTVKAWNVNRQNKIWAMDLSPTATKWNAKRYPQFQCFVGAAPNIPVDEKFDLIFVLEIMCYLEPEARVQTVRSIHEKLVPGGKVLFSGVLDGGVRHHTTEEVLGLFAKDFTVEKIHFNHWALYRKLIEHPLMKIDQRINGYLEALDQADEQYLQWKTGASGLKRGLVGFLRGIRPLSTGLLKVSSWTIRKTVGSVMLVRLLQVPSMFSGAKNADEIVVLAVRR